MLLEGLSEGFLIDTAVDGEEADQECLFVRVNALGKEGRLIGLTGATECIVITRDDLSSECPVMDNGCMGGEVPFGCDSMKD